MELFLIVSKSQSRCYGNKHTQSFPPKVYYMLYLFFLQNQHLQGILKDYVPIIHGKQFSCKPPLLSDAQ